MTSRKPKRTRVEKTRPNLIVRFSSFFHENKKELLVISGTYFLIAILLRYFYPYTDLASDTGGYINWALRDFEYGGPRPLGYSYFLYYLRQISGSTTIIFIAQYLLHCISILSFCYTVIHICNIKNKVARYGFLLISIIYIPAIYMTNMIMSDSIFTSLTVIIFTLSAWMLHSKSWQFIIPISIILFCIITIRYIGLIYPAFVIPVCLFFFRKRVVGITLSALLLLIIYGYTEKVKSKTEEDQGIRLFSAFGGWQIANNALHIVPHLDKSKPMVENQDPQIQMLDSVIRTTYSINKECYPGKDTVTYMFIWQNESPLRTFLNYYRATQKPNDYYEAWNEVGEIYANYGNELIKKNPGKFFNYYLSNNTKNMIYPNGGFLNSFADSSYYVIRYWFGWDEDINIQPRKDVLRPLLIMSPKVYSFYWILFAAATVYIGIMIFKNRLTKPAIQLVSLMVGFILLYSAASIYAAPVNLRFLFPIRMMMIGVIFIAINQIFSNRHIKA